MKLDLLSIVNNNKKIKEEEIELGVKKDLLELLSSIIKGEERFYTDNIELINRIKLKYKKNEYINCLSFRYLSIKYKVELTDENIKKIQKYIDDMQEEK